MSFREGAGRCLFVLALAGVLTACHAESEGAFEPVVSGPEAAVVQDASGTVYEKVRGRVPEHVRARRVSRVMGSEGGSLRLAGHVLEVPAGAVGAPTRFSMTLSREGYVEVDLGATEHWNGETKDVGARGFKRPITLELTYRWASNVEDPSGLMIGWIRSDGVIEPKHSTVRGRRSVVRTELEHFSRYAMVTNKDGDSESQNQNQQ